MSNEQTEQMIKSQEKGEAYRAGHQGADERRALKEGHQESRERSREKMMPLKSEPTQEEQRGDQQDSGQRNPPAR